MRKEVITLSTVLLLCWRDEQHPHNGGSEKYQLEIAQHLTQWGHQVHIVTAHYPHSYTHEKKQGISYYRMGNRYTVYPTVLVKLLLARLGFGPLAHIRPDVIIDTQNGVPFFAHITGLAPTIVLIHHCHRNQWPVAGRFLSKLGWFIESRVSPWIHKHNTYVTVSHASKRAISELGVDAQRIHVVQAGISPGPIEYESDNHLSASSQDTLRFSTLSRLVPHKQIEHSIDIIADLLPDYPQVQLDIIGDGWWKEQLQRHAHHRQVTDHIHFHGHVSEETKYQLLSQSYLHLMPSKAEGWCLAVTEAASLGIPSVGYTYSGGLNDSIQNQQTGFVVDNYHQLLAHTRQLLENPVQRETLGANARAYAQSLQWEASARSIESIIDTVTSVSSKKTSAADDPSSPAQLTHSSAYSPTSR